MEKGFIAFHAKIHPGPAAGSGGHRIDVALEDQSAWSAIRSTWPEIPAFQGLSYFSDPPSGTADALWSASQNVVWDYERSWPDGEPTPGFKQISLVRRRPDITTEEFRERYLGHADVAREHHGLWRYAQNVDLELVSGDIGDGRPPVDGISELWFESYEAMRDRFYLHATSADAVKDDTLRFIDFSNTYSVLVRETVVRS